MRFSFTAVDGRDGTTMDLVVDLDPDQPVSDLLPVVLAALNPDVHPSFAARVPTWLDAALLDPGRSIRSVGLRSGSYLEFHQCRRLTLADRGMAELRVVGGPGAGRIHRLGVGQTRVGYRASGLALADPKVPPAAAEVQVNPRCEVTVTLVEAESARLGDLELTANDESVVWPAGEYLRLGDCVIQLTGVGVPAAEHAPGEDHTGLDVVRPPRILAADLAREFTLPTEPTERPKQAIPWLMVFAPMLMTIPMVAFFGPRALIFAIMSPIMAIANVISARRGTRKTFLEEKKKYEENLADVNRRIDRGLLAEHAERRLQHPDPAAVLLTAITPGRELWQRRRNDPDHLQFRLGLADLTANLKVNTPQVEKSKEPPPPRVLELVPAYFSLRSIGVIGFSGPVTNRMALANWILGQIVVLHSPVDVRIILLTHDDSFHWEWVRWLPHLRTEAEILPATVGTEQQSIGRRLAELAKLLADRQARTESQSKGELPPGPDIVVVLDGARKLRSLPTVVQLLREGPQQGIYLMCLDEETRQLPEECTSVVEFSATGRVGLRRTRAAATENILPDLVEPGWGHQLARGLAPLRDATPDAEDLGLPKRSRLLTALDLEPPTVPGILQRWLGGRETNVVIGAGFDGPFKMDLKRDGPHALIAGTTGSGKSELLQTIVASLAVANRADQLTFVLVDYKGGSAFKDCARLPHTVGMVTDLNNHLVSRALVSLGAELKRREHLLVAPGAKDLEDYWALQKQDPQLPDIPRLVLVIDEFASLVAELPDFVQGLVSIAQRGRSLGIHLVLATQRPTGVVSADIRANTNLRISLRVTDEAESRDVIDAPEAARIARSTPGRGYIRTGHSTLMPFQTGRVGGRRPDSAPVKSTSAAPLVWSVPWPAAGLPVPTRAKPQQATTDEGETDLSLLVEVIGQAHELAKIPTQSSPWLPPLPLEVRASSLQGQVPQSEDVGLPQAAAWALLDEPAEQHQSVRTYALGKNSHMLIVGGPRTGRSMALRTIAACLAEQVPMRDLHIYGLDCGNGALLSLIELPQVGAVVTRTQTERADRLFRRLSDEVARRQELLGELGFADIAEQRRAVTTADERLPYLVLLIDRWEGFMGGLGELDNGRMAEEVQQLLKEGASAGLHVLISGDRSVINGRLVSLVEEIFALRLPNKDDYQGLSLNHRDIPQDMSEGRGIWSGSELEGQIAVLEGEINGAGQSAAVLNLGDRLELEPVNQKVPELLRPFQLEALPTLVPAESILPHAGPGGTPLLDSPFTWMPFGIGGDTLEILGHDMEISTNVVISGLPKTGRTSVLRFVATAATRRGQHVLGLFPRRNALVDQLEADSFGTALLGPELNSDRVLEVISKLPNGTVVMIDDGDMAREGAAAGALLALSKQARERDLSLITAGNVIGFGSTMSGWIQEAKREQQGLVLSPRNPGEGEVFGRRLSRSHIVSRTTPGRAVLMVAGLEPVSLQVPFIPPPTPAPKK